MSAEFKQAQEARDAVRAFEDEKLTRWQRFRLRYMNKDTMIAWNLSSIISYAQAAVAFTAVAGPAFIKAQLAGAGAFLMKVWGWFVTGVTAAVSILSP